MISKGFLSNLYTYYLIILVAISGVFTSTFIFIFNRAYERSNFKIFYVYRYYYLMRKSRQLPISWLQWVKIQITLNSFLFSLLYRIKKRRSEFLRLKFREKGISVTITNGNFMFPDKDIIIIERFYLLQVNNVRSVDA